MFHFHDITKNHDTKAYNYVAVFLQLFKMEESQLPYLSVSSECNPSWSRVEESENHLVYYRNNLNEIRWLQDCKTCGKGSEKWCLQCGSSYCEKDFVKVHCADMKQVSDPIVLREYSRTAKIDRSQFLFHQWAPREMPLEENTINSDELCIHCKRIKASKLCAECWDPYCQRCFELVHHIGGLKDHKPLNMTRAKLAWFILPNHENPNHDLYINGFTGENRSDKPPELMSDLERVLSQNWTNHRKAKEEYFSVVEDLRAQLDIAIVERDKVTVELAQLANQIKQKLEERKKNSGKK